jgi:FeS assembly protein IscX
MVCELEDFEDKPESSNEKILENIQMSWYEERQ